MLFDGWTSSQPSLQTLYADAITSKTDGASVCIADSQGLYVTGNVGIGTASPGYPLDVVGNLIRIKNPSAGTWIGLEPSAGNKWQAGANNWGYSIWDWTNSAYRLTVDNTGNVGIGTTAPLGKLHVYHAAGSEFFTADNADGIILANKVASKSIGMSASQSGSYGTSGQAGIKII